MNRLVKVLAVCFAFALAPLAAAAESGNPDATIELSGSSLGVGVGLSQAEGTLNYQGKSYPVSLLGVSVAEVGATKFSATGKVYHLGRVDDVAGSYTATSSGAALVDGKATMTMKNDKGVVIELQSASSGVNLKLAVDGVSLKLSK